MRCDRFWIIGMALAAAACQAAPANQTVAAVDAASVAAGPVTLEASDGVIVHGTYTPVASPKALILLFHQAGSNKAEYATIAPRLADAGYSSLAIDQRAGGAMFGTRNATADGLGRSADYAEAERDLQAALGWAGDKGLPVIAWGSSYSAALVFLLAAKNPGKLAALLAFSPDEYLGKGDPVRAAAAKAAIPVFVTSAKDYGEIAAARAIFETLPGAPAAARFEPGKGGVHGSSTLIAALNAKGADENWAAVSAFLGRVAP